MYDNLCFELFKFVLWNVVLFKLFCFMCYEKFKHGLKNVKSFQECENLSYIDYSESKSGVLIMRKSKLWFVILYIHWVPYLVLHICVYISSIHLYFIEDMCNFI